MTFIKTSFLSALASISKLFSGLLINKLIAVQTGSAGLALIGQFQDFLRISTAFAQAGLNTGVTKYTAEQSKEGQNHLALYSTAFKISTITSTVVAIITILAADYLSTYFLKSDQYADVFQIFGITVILYTLNGLVLSILNGLRKIKLWTIINICQSLAALVLTAILSKTLGIKGILLALATNQSIVFFIALILMYRYTDIKMISFLGVIRKQEVLNLLNFSLMTITTIIALPAVHLYVRNYIGENFGWDAAGLWQGITYISTTYLMLVTSILSVYYLPTIAMLNNREEIFSEVSRGLRIIIPVVTVLSLAIYLFKGIIISILFSENFRGMEELFLWQMVGNVIKIAAWLFSYVILAKAMSKVFISLEVVFAFYFGALSVFFLSQYGLIGVTYAYCVNYCTYLLVAAFVAFHGLEHAN